MQLSVAARMGLGFGAVLAAMTAGALIMTVSIGSVKERADQIRSESLPFADEAAHMQFDAVNVQQFLTDVSATGNEDGFKEADTAAREFRQGLAKFEAMARKENDTKMRNELQAIGSDFDAMYAVGVRMAKTYVKDGRQAGNVLMEDFDARTEALSKRIIPLKDSQFKEADDQMTAVVIALTQDLWLQYGLLVLSLAIGVTTAVIVSRSILRQLGAEPEVVAALARDVADGRFDTMGGAGAKAGNCRGVLAAMVAMAEKLQASFVAIDARKAEAEAKAEEAERSRYEAEQAMVQAERARLEGMAEAADRLEGLATAVAQAGALLAERVAQVARGTARQHERTTETATAMEEMNATVLEVAKNAAQAAESARAAREGASEGMATTDAVNRSIETVRTRSEGLKTSLDALGERAKGIGAIMNVISDIADQTNLLALNAAIEAARAGEAGRGFAVVADEVRKLAEKTMNATKEVATVIADIGSGVKENIVGMDAAVVAVGDATTLAGKAGAVLRHIVDMVETATDEVRSIATASEQQSATSDEINRALTDINHISDETAQGMDDAKRELAKLEDSTGELSTVIASLRRESGKAPAPLTQIFLTRLGR